MRDEPRPRSSSTVEALCGDLGSIRAPRGRDAACPLVVDGGAAADAAEQPRPRGRRSGPRSWSSTAAPAARPAATTALKAIVRSLLRLGDDETLLVQSGKPVGVFRTHAGAPRVLIANAMLVPRWATWDEFRRLEALGLTMYGQMTAGSWIYIGTQGILQGTYQTFAAAGEQHFGAADLAGRSILTAGLGGMGGAQPLAGDDAERGHPVRRGRPGADRAPPRDAVPGRGGRVARRRARPRCARRSARGAGLSVGLLGNAADVVPELARRGEAFDLVTDQTAAHDPLNGYVPRGLDVDAAAELRAADPVAYLRTSA